MKTNKILLTTLLLSSLTLVSCGENNETSNSTSSNTTDSSLSSSTKPELTEAEKQEKIYTTFKDTVMKEFAYDKSKTLKIDAKVAGEPHVFDGETELTEEQITELAINAAPMNLDIVSNTSLDTTNNTYTKATVDPTTKEASLEEFYYVENGVEYKCYNTQSYDVETGKFVPVKARQELDNGHIAAISKIKPADEISFLTESKTFDELIENGKKLVGGIALVKDFNVKSAKITTKDVEDMHHATINASLSASILGIMDVTGDIEGTLKYTDDKIDSFVVTGTGTLTTTETKGEKDYKVKQNLTINANILLSREASELIPTTLIDEYKAAAATKAPKVNIQASSIFGDISLPIIDNEVSLPKNIAELKHCDVKVYKDKAHTEEVALYTLERKTYELDKLYIDIKPEFGYALLIETQVDPAFGFNTVKNLELKTLNEGKYEYRTKVELDSDWGGNNGKDWTSVTLNGEKVADTTKPLALENGKIYKVEYKLEEAK